MKIAIIGCGLIGGFLGGVLISSGQEVVFVGRQSFIDEILKSKRLLITGENCFCGAVCWCV